MSIRHAAAILLTSGLAASAALTPEGVQKDLDAASTASFFESVWGLVCPESSETLAEIKDVTADRHEALTLLPPQSRFENGALVFTLGPKPATVGAWNCENKLPRSRRPSFGVRFDVEIECEQTADGPTVLTLIPWYGGNRMDLGRVVARAAANVTNTVYQYCRRELEGGGRRVIKIENTGEFFRRVDRSPFDGFELEFRGPAGTEIKVHRIRASRRVRRGGFRCEFELPPGPVWRAVGNINRKTLVYLNGVEVPNSSVLSFRPHPHFSLGQQWQEVDLKPYLKPGKNVMAAKPAFDADANALLRASIVMASGDAVDVSTSPAWRYVPDCGAGWAAAGYTGETRSITNERPFSASHMPTDLTAIRYGYRLYMQETHNLPAYDGRLLLHSPDDNQLYFSDDRPFQVLARCPAGLAAANPAVDWLLCRYRKGAALEAVLSGTASAGPVDGESLVFELSGGETRVPTGLYVLKTVLQGADGRVLEDRISEPCIVTGKIPMGTTDGKTFEDGLDLEPEAVIDYTKPDDPRFPWMEMAGTNLYTDPLIVTRNGLTYRETRPADAAFGSRHVLITHNYEFRHPGDFYLMELEYPDDQPRFFGVCLSSEHYGSGDHSKAGPAVWNGIWHLNTGRMQTLAWLYRPDPGFSSINLINMLPGGVAAASRLTLRHVKGVLPELKTRGAERRFGILMEHSGAGCGFAQTFRSSAAPKSGTAMILNLKGQWEANARSNSPLAERLDSLDEWLDTCLHYTEYQRWAGQNLIFLSFYTYSGNREEAGPFSVTGDGRLVFNITDIAARVFRDNGIEFFSSIHYCSDPALLALDSGGARPDLTDSMRLISRHGQEVRHYERGYNFNHPRVRESMLAIAAEAVRKFQKLPNFRGVHFPLAFEDPLMLPNYFSGEDEVRPIDPLRFDYSDVTVRRFEQAAGLSLDVAPTSLDRFAMRHRLLTAEPLRERWIEWRAQNMVDFYLEFRDRLRELKPDVDLVTGVGTPMHFFEYMTESGAGAEQAMREFGWDFPKFHGHEGLYTMPWLAGSARYGFTYRNSPQTDRYQDYLRALRANLVPAHLKIGDGATERMAMVDYGWLELERGAQAVLPKRPHWQVPYQYTLEAQAQGDYALAPYLRVMAAIDPDSVAYGFTDTNLKIGGEQPLREFARFLRSLPKAKFEPFEGPDAELIVRTLRQDGALLFYVLNPAPWPMTTTLELEGAREVTDRITGSARPAPVTVTIPAYHGASFEAPGGASLKGWTTEATGADFPAYRQHLEETLRKTAARMADRRIRSVLLPDQDQALQELLKRAEAALAAGHPAEVWQLLAGWDFIWGSYFLERQAEALQLVTEHNPPPPDLGPRTLAAPRAAVPPTVDGNLSDPLWRGIAPVGGFVDQDGRPALVGTEVRTAWDAVHLYVAFVCRDTRPDQLKKDATGESGVFQDDCVVLFLQPDRERSRHFQMAFNAAGVKFDQRDYDYAFAPDWDVAVRVTTNGWTAEAALPLAALEAQPAPGRTWGINFCRLFRMNRVPWSTWRYMPRNWHDPKGYGALEFKEPAS